MKKLLFLLGLTVSLLCLSGVSSLAQDVIIKLDGTEIEVYVDEISDSIIQYRRYDNPTGPIYKLSTSSIARIEYENGVVEEYNNKPVEEPPVLSDKEKKKQEELDRKAQKKMEEDRKRMEKELENQEKERKKQEQRQQRALNSTQKKGYGLSLGALMNWELLHSNMYNSVYEGLTYSGLRPSIYLDYHFASWFYAGVNGSFSIRKASKQSSASTNSLNFWYQTNNIGVNGHLGLQVPFSSRKMGISVYGGPTISWNISSNAYYSISTKRTFNVPSQQMDLTVGIKLKSIVCLAAEYHIPLGGIDQDRVGIPAYYWSFGVGLGF